MSAVEHAAQADREEKAARAHEERYDPGASTNKNGCSDPAVREPFDVCWGWVANPTEQHLAQAELHRKHAADHRAASDALRRAEAQSCAGLAVGDRDVSPFAHTEDIAGVERLTVPDLAGDTAADADKTVGAVITFRAVSGMTAEWLQRVIDCHLARNAALGHVAPEMPDCPLVLRGVSAKVASTGVGFAVSVQAADRATAREVLARAERLASAAKRR
ncbi:MAG: hypothetical protein IPI67_24095 [Myxococcales bacterium]|nr:hypothetical protein [Myxococcales bacterium]